MMGAVIAAWFGVGLFAVCFGVLSIKERSRPVKTYIGIKARVLGLIIVFLSVFSAFIALYFPTHRRHAPNYSVKWTAAAVHANLTRTVAAATYLRR
jgi:multisubunit Na+/H+ antiporter MnhB subunit